MKVARHTKLQLTATLLLALLLGGCSDSETASSGGVGGAFGVDGAAGAAGTGGQPPDTCSFRETFEDFAPGAWQSGTFGSWTTVYIDTVGIETDAGNVHFQHPIASTSSDETHANLVVTTQSFAGDLDFSVRMKTVEQLRSGSAPNNWEVAWIFWGYQRPEQSYYFVPKPLGWELGKSDDTKADPSGPECDWPSYDNCLYPGAQRYLATGDSPSFPVGEWHTVRVTQSGGSISIWANGTEITSVSDHENVLENGMLGLYNEDAHVRFDDVCVK